MPAAIRRGLPVVPDVTVLRDLEDLEPAVMVPADGDLPRPAPAGVRRAAQRGPAAPATELPAGVLPGVDDPLPAAAEHLKPAVLVLADGEQSARDRRIAE